MVPKFLTYGIIILLSLFYAGRESRGDDGRPTEYQVKAAYIYNFAKFVEWPGPRSGDIEVCILGDNPFGGDLSIIEGKKVTSSKINIKKVASYRNTRGCDILFISDSEEYHLTQILNFLKRSPVLTIGDSEEYAEKGVMINFYMENRMVRFEINPAAASRAGLRISSNLLKIAKIVDEE